jgi:hypothetical protein
LCTAASVAAHTSRGRARRSGRCCSR